MTALLAAEQVSGAAEFEIEGGDFEARAESLNSLSAARRRRARSLSSRSGGTSR